MYHGKRSRDQYQEEYGCTEARCTARCARCAMLLRLHQTRVAIRLLEEKVQESLRPIRTQQTRAGAASPHCALPKKNQPYADKHLSMDHGTTWKKLGVSVAHLVRGSLYYPAVLSHCTSALASADHAAGHARCRSRHRNSADHTIVQRDRCATLEWQRRDGWTASRRVPSLL